jgi:hypothetical protein
MPKVPQYNFLRWHLPQRFRYRPQPILNSGGRTVGIQPTQARTGQRTTPGGTNRRARGTWQPYCDQRWGGPVGPGKARGHPKIRRRQARKIGAGLTAAHPSRPYAIHADLGALAVPTRDAVRRRPLPLIRGLRPPLLVVTRTRSSASVVVTVVSYSSAITSSPASVNRSAAPRHHRSATIRRC